MDERLLKWRLILGSKSDAAQQYELEPDDQNMDDVLDALYDTDRKGDLGTSSPNVNRWLGDIRKYFPASVVQVMQKDALDRLGLKRLLLEPELLETIEMDVHLVATILNLQKVMPAKTRQTAREVVRKVLKELEEKLRNPLRQAIEGSLSRMVRNRRPKHNEIDWHQTIRRNLKHYQADYKTIIPEQLIGYGKKGQALRDVILLLDQSGSMSASVVYSSILAAVMASLRSLKTHLIAFDTAVVDLTEELHDPVELLFAVQLGGGTDINQALAYAEKLVRNPTDTILVLISDLFEGGNEQELLRRIARVKSSGVQFISLLALSDKGAPAFDRNVASALAAMDIPAFACTPDQFPGLMAAAIQKEDIRGWMGREGIVGK
jgi:Mg-chelatase subunit ChlD